MSQHALTIANQAGASFRADTVNAIQALGSNSLGTTAPATTYAGQIWIDTGTSIDAIGGPWIRKRNSANSGWTRQSHADSDLINEIVTQAYTGWTTTGTAPSFVATPLPAWTAYSAGQRLRIKLHAGPAGSDTLNVSGLGAKSFKQYDNSGAKIAAVLASGQLFDAEYDGTDMVILNPLPPIVSGSPPVRQTILSGPVDTSGLPAFGGSTGSTTVTASGTLKATAGAGAGADYTGSIVNPSWTGLSTNGTMYLGLAITAGGVVTTASTTLAPIYQWGGTPSVTSGQYTYNIQEGKMYLGNGATAPQVFVTFAGEVTVAGGVVTAITWYALNGRYLSADTATLPGSGVAISKSHNVGCQPQSVEFWIRNTTTDAGYAVGDVVRNPNVQPPGNFSTLNVVSTRLAVGITSGDYATPWTLEHKSTGTRTQLVLADWSYFFTAQRGW